MSDSYQAIYDATRSRIGHGDAGEAIYRAAREMFDISFQIPIIVQEFSIAAGEMQRPSAIYRPSIGRDGNKWCALYGSNLAEGVAGFGDSPDEAMRDFDKNWHEKIAATKGGEK